MSYVGNDIGSFMAVDSDSMDMTCVYLQCLPVPRNHGSANLTAHGCSYDM